MNTTTQQKGDGQTVSRLEFNNIIQALNSKADRACEKAFSIPQPQASGIELDHGFGAELGVSSQQYYLELRAYTLAGAPISDMTVQKLTADRGRVNYNDPSMLFAGIIILKAILF